MDKEVLRGRLTERFQQSLASADAEARDRHLCWGNRNAIGGLLQRDKSAAEIGTIPKHGDLRMGDVGHRVDWLEA